jgi:hypothetical protein
LHHHEGKLDPINMDWKGPLHHVGWLSTSSIDGNDNDWFHNDKSCHSNVFMTSHALPMMGCLPSNAFNDTKTSSIMCTRLAQMFQTHPSCWLKHI